MDASNNETTAVPENTTDAAPPLTVVTKKKPPTDKLASLSPKKNNVVDSNTPAGTEFTENGESTSIAQEHQANESEQIHSDEHGRKQPGVDGGDPVGKVEIRELSECRPLDTPPLKKVSHNVLHNFSSYTYNISLHALEHTTYNEIMNGAGYVPKHVLIAGAGRRGENFARDGLFEDDFYFDKLEMTTVIGMTPQAKNSNAISLDFTIIEPYGMTLINKLIDLASEIGLKGNHTRIPYLLQIDFFGYDSNGNPQKIKDITKKIPIQLVSMNIKITNKGAEYVCSAVPFNHQAFSQTIATVPFRLEVTASTVGEFFKSDVDATEAANIQGALTNADTVQKGRMEALLFLQREIISLEKLEDNYRTKVKNIREADSIKNNIKEKIKYFETVKKAYASDPVTPKVKSFAQAVNTWKKNLVDTKVVEGPPDSVHFDFVLPSMRTATFPTKDEIQTDSINMSRPGEKQTGTKTNLIQADTKDKPGNLNIMSVNAGQSVLDVLSKAMLNSSYITEQVLDPHKTKITKEELKKFIETPLKWYRAIPRIELGRYNEKNGEFQKKITYRIVPYEVGNCMVHEAHMAPPKQFIKDYNYIFKGKNEDIINFNLQFDALYFTSQPANPANMEVAAQSKDKVGTNVELLSTDQIKKIINEILTDKVRGNASMRHRQLILGETPGESFQTGGKADRVKNLSNNLLSGAAGDMIRVDLKIVGDPEFIKQDDMFYNFGIRHAEEDWKTPNGSIITDDGAIYVHLAFNNAGDYNDNGLVQIDKGKDTVSAFSGIYQVITVKNMFSGGKFEQDLELFRHPYQPTPGVSDSTNRSQGTSEAEKESKDPGSDVRSDETSSTLPNSTPSTKISASSSDIPPDVISRINSVGPGVNVTEQLSRPYGDVKGVPSSPINESSPDGGATVISTPGVDSTDPFIKNRAREGVGLPPIETT